mgnify:CR=1 FL=1
MENTKFFIEKSLGGFNFTQSLANPDKWYALGIAVEALVFPVENTDDVDVVMRMFNTKLIKCRYPGDMTSDQVHDTMKKQVAEMLTRYTHNLYSLMNVDITDPDTIQSDKKS